MAFPNTNDKRPSSIDAVTSSLVSSANCHLLVKDFLNIPKLNYAKKNAFVMHPGPMNRGLEISAESADDIKSVVIDQVKNGVSVRMAVLYELLGGVALNEEKNGDR